MSKIQPSFDTLSVLFSQAGIYKADKEHQFLRIIYAIERRCSAIVQKVAVSRKSPCGDWKTLSVNPAVNGYLFGIREG